MPKQDYYDDPAAPRANSIVVAVTAAVRNPQGELLLIERTDNGLWALPGGAQNLGESVVEAPSARSARKPALMWRSRA